LFGKFPIRQPPGHMAGDRLRVGWLDAFSLMRVPREQKMPKGHLRRVIYHQVYEYTKVNHQPWEDAQIELELEPF